MSELMNGPMQDWNTELLKWIERASITIKKNSKTIKQYDLNYWFIDLFVDGYKLKVEKQCHDDYEIDTVQHNKQLHLII